MPRVRFVFFWVEFPNMSASASVASTETFERKTLPNGKPNPKYVDLCDEDAPIAGQKFMCVSFVSPENILKKREGFLFEEFLKQWEFQTAMSKFGDFLNFAAYKYNLSLDTVLTDYNEFVVAEQTKLRETDFQSHFRTFCDKNEEALTLQFNREHAFQTSVRGFKCRGNFNTQEEAEMHCKKLREKDPHHDIFVGPVGTWVPWDPDAYKTGRVEFMEEELNQLHKEKLKNEELAKQSFDNRVREAKKKAIQDNLELAKKSGNVLTQTVDDAGNLVGVKENVDFDARDVADEDERNVHAQALKDALLNGQTNHNGADADATSP